MHPKHHPQPNSRSCTRCLRRSTCTAIENAPSSDADTAVDDALNEVEVALWMQRITQAQLFRRCAGRGARGISCLFDVSEQLTEN